MVGHKEHAIIATTILLGDSLRPSVCISKFHATNTYTAGRFRYPWFIAPHPSSKIHTARRLTIGHRQDCWKVPLAHDRNDYALGQKHGTERQPLKFSINTAHATRMPSTAYIVEDRFVVRKKIVKQFKTKGLLRKGHHVPRTWAFHNAPMQWENHANPKHWFVKMKALTAPVLQYVWEGSIRLHPAKFRTFANMAHGGAHDWFGVVLDNSGGDTAFPYTATVLTRRRYGSGPQQNRSIAKSPSKTGNAALIEVGLQLGNDLLDMWSSF